MNSVPLIFYVYEWFNLDNDEVFYVGKGNKNRYKNTTSRNNYFKNYYSKHKCDVRKIKSNLSEQESLDLEIDTIKRYKELGQCQCNLTEGGEGATYEPYSWNWIYSKLHFLWYMTDYLDIMNNIKDYDPTELKDKPLEEIWNLWVDYKETVEGIRTYNDMFDEADDIGIGWECFED